MTSYISNFRKNPTDSSSQTWRWAPAVLGISFDA